MIMNFDASENKQLTFQSPATDVMNKLIDLHNDIFSVMVILATIVFYMICQNIFNFRAGNF